MEAIVAILTIGAKYGPSASNLAKTIFAPGADIPKEELLKLLDQLGDELVAGEVLIPKRPG